MKYLFIESRLAENTLKGEKGGSYFKRSAVTLQSAKQFYFVQSQSSKSRSGLPTRVA